MEQKLQNENAIVELPDKHQEAFLDPEDFPLDVHVTYQQETHLFEVQETTVENGHPANRYFTIEGGIPPEMLDDVVVKGIAKELGLHMQSVVLIL